MMRNLSLFKNKYDFFKLYIYLFIFLMPWNFNNGQMGLLSGVLLLWWLIIGYKRGYFTKLKPLLTEWPLVLLILFFLYGYTSLLWTDNVAFGIKTTLDFYKYYWIIIPVLFSSLSPREAKTGIYVFVLSLGSYAIFSLIQFLDLIRIKTASPSNPKGHLAYAVVTAYMALGCLMGIAISLWEKEWRQKLLFGSIGLLCFFALFVNNGRASQFAFFATLIVLIFYYRKSLFKNSKVAFVLLVLTLFSLGIFVNSGQFDRFSRGVEELKNMKENKFSGSWGHRAYMWYAAGHILAEHPLLGTGAGDNIDAFINYTETHPSKAHWLRTFHNQHLEYLTKFGILGYSLFLASIVLLLRVTMAHNTVMQPLSFIFLFFTLINCLGDILLLMKPFNTIFVLVFLLLLKASKNE